MNGITAPADQFRERVLLLPFLYFKDERQSSGIIHQAELAKALAAAGHSVVVAMPSGKDWRYDHQRWFGGFDNLTVRPVDYPQDLNFTAGLISPELARLLTPEQTDLPLGVVFCGIPEVAMSIKRFLYKKGHSRLNVPVVTFFDSVMGFENGKPRTGRGVDFIKELSQLQVLSTLDCPAVLHSPDECEVLQQNIRGLLSPSRARQAMGNVHHVRRPFAPPAPPRRRPYPDGDFRLFMALSFGQSDEEKGWMTEPVIRAVKYLRIKGVPIRTVLATQSRLDSWARAVINDVGDSLELMHERPREAVLQALYDCELSAYLCDYHGNFMASLEAVCSGSPHLFKSTRYSEGVVASPFSVTSFEVEEIMAALTGMLADFDGVADTAYANALIETELRDPAWIGHELGRIMAAARQAVNPDLSLARFKSMGETLGAVAGSGQFVGLDLGTAVARLARARDSGHLGRLTLPWAAWAFEQLGYSLRLTGGLQDSGAWLLTDFRTPH